jgi:pimeloyl-ACP methyl ester carboxylesterase
MSTLREFEVALLNGTTLSCAEHGDPSGQPVLLLHGYSDSWRSYRLMMPELPRTVRTIAVTLRGHGDSSKPPGSYGVGVFANDVVEVMDTLAIARAVVVGHSMGSLVARRIAVEHGERVSALMLIGGFAAVKGNAAAEALWRDAIVAMQDPVDPAFVHDFQQSTLARPVPAAFFADVVAQSLKMPARVWQSTFRALLDEDRSDELGHVGAPTTIVWGDQDAFSGRAEQARMAREIPQARLVVYGGTGHSPQWEEPARVAGDLLALLLASGARRAA